MRNIYASVGLICISIGFTTDKPGYYPECHLVIVPVEFFFRTRPGADIHEDLDLDWVKAAANLWQSEYGQMPRRDASCLVDLRADPN